MDLYKVSTDDQRSQHNTAEDDHKRLLLIYNSFRALVFPFLGGFEAPQQDKLEKVWHEGGTHGAAGARPEGIVDVSRHAGAQFEL